MIAQIPIYFYIIIGVLCSLIFWDILSNKGKVIGAKKALRHTFFWFFLSISFSILLLFFGDTIMGIESMKDIIDRIVKYNHPIDIDAFAQQSLWQEYRNIIFIEFLSGYFIEYTLSIDNIFVMSMIIAFLKIQKKHIHGLLFWGILGAIVMRIIFIVAGAELVNHFHYTLYLFGLFLISIGIHQIVSMLIKKGEKEEKGIEDSRFFRLVKLIFPVDTSKEQAHRFFFFKNNKLWITYLGIALLMIEFSDLLFALDSIPAIFAFTSDPFLIIYANIFAILGLRSLFFLLESIIDKFEWLKLGIAIMLVGVGCKLLLNEFLKSIFQSPISNLYLIGLLFFISFMIPFLFYRKKV